MSRVFSSWGGGLQSLTNEVASPAGSPTDKEICLLAGSGPGFFLDPSRRQGHLVFPSCGISIFDGLAPLLPVPLLCVSFTKHLRR